MPRLTFGKYNGAEYHKTLGGDLNYCQYIASLPDNDRIAEFQKWLNETDLNGKTRLQLAEAAAIDKKAETIRKLYARN